MLVSSPHTQQFAPMLNMVATGTATTIETFTVFQRDRKDTGVLVIAGFRLVFHVSRIFVVTDDRSIVGDFHVLVFGIDHFSQLNAQRIGRSKKDYFLDNHPPFPVRNRYSTGLFINFQSISAGRYFKLLFIVFRGNRNRVPIRLNNSVTLHQRLRKG